MGRVSAETSRDRTDLVWQHHLAKKQMAGFWGRAAWSREESSRMLKNSFPDLDYFYLLKARGRHIFVTPSAEA
jgi:hypothetical protein